MKLDYLKFHDMIVKRIAALEFEREKPLIPGKYCKRYEGEFDSFTLPEEYNPKSVYCFVKIRNGKPAYAKSPSAKRPGMVFEVLLFIGSNTVSREDALEDVLMRVPIIHRELQGTYLKDENGDVLGSLLLSIDEEQFARPNHVCWASVYTLTCEKIEL